MSADLSSPRPTSVGRAQSVVRRVIVLTLLFALVVIAAVGISGLIQRTFDSWRSVPVDEAALARSLAFAFVGGPLAAALWWWERRKLAEPSERTSMLWALYLVAMSLTALVVATVQLSLAVGAAIEGRWETSALCAGVVWLGVWVWHWWMRRSRRTAPTRLVAVPDGLGALFGLVVAASGTITAFALLIGRALLDASLELVSTQPWVISLLQALVWGVFGALVWWWHWFHARAATAAGEFAALVLVVVVGLAAATTLFATGTALFVLLRILFDTVPMVEALAPLDTAIAAALIGAIIWTYHVQVVSERSPAVRGAARLVVSAVALAGAASGFGVVVNALLATFGRTLVDSDPRSLLLGGISALVIGAPVWWIAWRPASTVAPEQAADAARRIYLVAVFGVSAVVAIITLLLVGYRLFEFGLDPNGPLIQRIRAPLGLLSATALVFAYHFAVWRRDRTAGHEAAHRPTIGRIVLVAGGDASAAARALHDETGAPVTVWSAADDDARLGEGDIPALSAALSALSAPRVLVVADAAGSPRIIPLAD